MSKLQVIAICIIATVLTYLAVTEYLPRMGTGYQSITEPQHRFEIVNQGYNSRYEHKGIPIEFSEDMIENKEKKDIADIKTALKLIEDNSPDDYRMLERYVDKITIVPVVMYDNMAGEYNPGTKSINILVQIINPKCVYCDLDSEGYEELAGRILHEACHSMRYHESMESALRYGDNISYKIIEEEACIGMENDFLERIGSEYRQAPYSASEE